jgi:hypothetical protein
MATIQLTELMPVETPLGAGYAVMVDSEAHDNYWTVVFDSGALVTFRQEEIKLSASYTYGRGTNNKRMLEKIK